MWNLSKIGHGEKRTVKKLLLIFTKNVLYKAEISMKQTIFTAAMIPALERFHCILILESKLLLIKEV